jgi:hypothetical protein
MMRHNFDKFIVVGIVIVGLLGCAPRTPGEDSPELTFQAPLQMNPDEEIEFQLGIHNDGPDSFPGDTHFNGVMELRESSGKLRARMDLYELETLGPNQEISPVKWHGHLTPGIYNLTWGAPDYGCLAVDFMVDYWDGCLTITHQTTTEYPSLVSTFVSETPFIVTQEVHTEDNNTITFSGWSALANGTCLESQLYEGVQPLDAWPTGLCIPVESGLWHVIATLHDDESVPALDPGQEYSFYIWQQGNPDNAAQPFWFDLTGPPAP